jgi:hypothetical protein
VTFGELNTRHEVSREHSCFGIYNCIYKASLHRLALLCLATPGHLCCLLIEVLVDGGEVCLIMAGLIEGMETTGCIRYLLTTGLLLRIARGCGNLEREAGFLNHAFEMMPGIRLLEEVRR